MDALGESVGILEGLLSFLVVSFEQGQVVPHQLTDQLVLLEGEGG